MARPQNLTGIEIECHESIAVRGWRSAVVVAGCDVERIVLNIDCRTRPDGRAGRSPLLNALLVFPDRPRFFGDRVRSPDLIAVRGVQRHKTAAETAALIIGRASRCFFSGGDAHIETSVIKRGEPVIRASGKLSAFGG